MTDSSLSGQGSAAGKYSIAFTCERNWGVVYVEGTGKIEARFTHGYFDFKNMGGDK